MQYNLFLRNQNYKFFSLGSGSSGNSYYLGTDEKGILIDAGIGIRTMRKRLKEHELDFGNIAGVLITHHHIDHIKSVGYLGGEYGIPIYATKLTHSGIKKNSLIKSEPPYIQEIIKKEKLFTIEEFKIIGFEIPHDSIDNLGFHIEFQNQIFVVATDVGRITQKIKKYASKANHLVLEANYDEEMLHNGKYSYYLKERISGGLGHLSNEQSAEFLAKIYNENLKNVWLCHLSKNNNNPDLVYRKFYDVLMKKGIVIGRDLELKILERHKLSGFTELK